MAATSHRFIVKRVNGVRWGILYASLLVLLHATKADYSCVCNDNVDMSVLPWVGYLQIYSEIQEKMCAGNAYEGDLVTTVPAPGTTPTTSMPTPTTTTPTTTTSTTTTTPTTTTTTIKFTTHKVPHGHMEICPQHIHTDVTFKGGYFGQYGSFCYALIDWPRAFDGAESHCISQSGTLAAITNQGQQDYIHQLLIEHHFNGKAWIGLNDKTAEGTLTWTSGAPVSFTNFEQGYNQHSTNTHKSNDCFVITQRGEWVDQSCGVAVSIINFGETHPFICQYNVSAHVHNLFNVLPGVISVG